MMKTNSTRRIVISGMMLALGLILPYATAHGFGMQGNVLLPMHIPVLLCGFICGSMYGALCGLLLPVLNSLLTGMPAMYPMALIMTCELTAYGLVSGLLNKAFGKSGKIYMMYPTLLIAMIAGRIVYGFVAWLLLFTGAAAGKFSVISAVITGAPGIIIQLILIPITVSRVVKPANPKEIAIDMIKSQKASCVTVRNGKIETKGSPRGIAYTIDLHEKNMLCGAFVADKVVGKAAAMIFTLGKVSSCYAENLSEEALKWLTDHNIPTEYTNISEHIVNRTGDGICPMELTVQNIENEEEAIEALKKKIEELKKH